jgi:hypothetical protein
LKPLSNRELAGRVHSAADRAVWGAFLLLTVAAANYPLIAAGADRRGPNPNDFAWIITAEEQPFSLALAAPVASHLRKSGVCPLVMTVTSPPTKEAEWLLTLSKGPRPIVFMPSGAMKLGATLKRRTPELLQIGRRPGEASAAVARRFWVRSREAVIAASDDPEAQILGSALSAALGVPLFLSDNDEICPAVAAVIKDLSVERLLVAVSDPTRSPQWIRRQEVTAVILRPEDLRHRLVAALGADKIRNVVVARDVDVRAGVGHSAWLAPYASLARGAAVVLTHAPSPSVAEADAKELIMREGLQPRTITIMADYASIGYRNVELDPPAAILPPAAAPVISGTAGLTGGTASHADVPSAVGVCPVPNSGNLSGGSISGGAVAAPAPPPPQPYIVRTEPFVTTQSDQLAELGVGRIPLESLSEASVFFARGLLRERLLANHPPRVLMVANSSPAPRGLPLCETMSRITAAEFKNFGIQVDEFYAAQTDSPEILTAARSANLILYEGHLSHQELIDAPILHRTGAQPYPLDEEDLEGAAAPGVIDRLGDRSAPPPAARVVVAELSSLHLQGPLEGLPIVALQSCESLDDAVLWRLDELGGAALIGSMTPIHSGGGTDMLNSAMTSLLYRGGTLGEALRDAQNYMFCVEELKARRGHKEMSKGVRVALSFRLWGDPEMQVLPAPVAAPRQPPVRAEWIGNGILRIHVPEERLPESRSDKYVASMFPNSQAAGLMRLEEGEPLKKVLPFYYFCLPLPQELAKSGATQLEPSRSDARRVHARIDRGRGLLYVVYYPDQENPGETVDLQLNAVATFKPGRRPGK